MPKRPVLSVDRIISAAAVVADRGGVAAVSMRTVARELGVEAMSLYHHVANKDALLDALADWVFAQIEPPELDEPWRDAMLRRARSARVVLGRHSWALGMLESRPTPGPALLRHHDRMVGCLLNAGFSPLMAAHAFSAVDAYLYGFVLTESGLPFTPGDGAEETFATEIGLPAAEYPHLAGLIGAVLADGYDFRDEFEYGLDLVLDGIESRLAAEG